jgi:hypothetical protein
MTCRLRSSSRVTSLNAYDYRSVHKSLRGIIRLANSTNVWRLRKCGRLSVENTLLEGLAQHLQHVAAELRQFIEHHKTMMRPWHLARQRHLPVADQPDIRNGMVQDTKGGA